MRALGVHELTGQEKVGIPKTCKGEREALWLRLFLRLKGTEIYPKQLNEMVYYWKMCLLQSGFKTTEVYLLLVLGVRSLSLRCQQG